MWPRLSRAIRDNPITALMSVLATAFTLVVQWQLLQEKCHGRPVPICVCETVSLCPPSKSEEDADAERDYKAWKDASRLDSAESYWQYLHHPWTRHASEARKRIEELAETDWNHEAKNSDSEERIADFINKYKEGPYVTLAQKRLKVARAWTAIKDSTAPSAPS